MKTRIAATILSASFTGSPRPTAGQNGHHGKGLILRIASFRLERQSARRKKLFADSSDASETDAALTVQEASVIGFKGRDLCLGDLGVWRSAHERAPGFFLADAPADAQRTWQKAR
jgi:hypothetical protein